VKERKKRSKGRIVERPSDQPKKLTIRFGGCNACGKDPRLLGARNITEKAGKKIRDPDKGRSNFIKKAKNGSEESRNSKGRKKPFEGVDLARGEEPSANLKKRQKLRTKMARPRHDMVTR